MVLKELGLKKVVKCFDGKEHECTCTDYFVAVNGNTYHNRHTLYELGFKYWNVKCHEWIKNVESDEELKGIKDIISDKGIRIIECRPVYRITDSETNPIDFC